MIDPDIRWYYERGREADRLKNNCQLEEASTRQIIEERLPSRQCQIVDIGGAAGAYAFWLTSLGHIVHLVDPIQLHIDQALQESERTGIKLAGATQADAHSLPFDGNSFDIALVLGPLYHLVERDSRISALREAFRVLKNDGMLFVAGISRYGSIADGFFKNFVDDPEFVEIMMRDIEDGQHRNPHRRPGYFTTAFFHRPEDLEAELEEAGFSGHQVLAIESIFGYIPDIAEKLKNESFRNLLMKTLKAIESDQSILGLGGHLMGVAQKGQ